MSSSTFHLTRSFADRLPDYAVAWQPMSVAGPRLLQFNSDLADELGLPVDRNDTGRLERVFAGQEMLPGAYPVAQAYAGHQFGGFVPQLGDGRALLLGEVVDRHGRCRDIAFKGSGPTPFSRGGDGKAAIGPVLREYLIGEAMHALGIPTTRALAAVSTGETVVRTEPLPGAILTRVAASHLRVGSFEYFAARRKTDHVTELAEFAIDRHDRELANQEQRYLL
ncbi:MAG: protein adenylyltransferase SelO family protein, partial [Blastopirellula sp. JB062]